MTGVGMLTTGLLKDVFLKEQLSLVATREHKLKLTEWLRKLPTAMQLNSLLRDQALTVPQRRSVFLLHLNYLGALLLLYRRHLFYLSTTHRGLPWRLDGDMDEALSYAEDAVATALQSARILRLLMSEKAIFKRVCLLLCRHIGETMIADLGVSSVLAHNIPIFQCMHSSAVPCSSKAASRSCSSGIRGRIVQREVMSRDAGILLSRRRGRQRIPRDASLLLQRLGGAAGQCFC